MIFLVAILRVGLLVKFTRSSLYFIFTVLVVVFLFSSLPIFSYRVHYESGYFIGDSVGFLLSYITVIVMVTSLYSYNFKFDPMLVYRVFTFLFVCSIMVFTTNNMFILYFFYESSLIPISYAIVKWGAYPERGYRALLIVLFTRVLTFPFILLVLAFVSYITCTPHFYLGSILGGGVPLALVFLIVLAFAVKLPLYGLHYWLPMAHVEAPTFGSMLLAGLLLKIGGCGLIRFSFLIFPVIADLNSYLVRYLIFSIVAVSLVCCAQSDMKRLVAYSSVLHMTFICVLVLAGSPLAFSCALIAIVFHGLSSPLLFFLVGNLYFLYKTRLLLALRNLTTFAPLLAIIRIFSFLLNIPVPPVPSFLREVLVFLSAMPLRWLFLIIALLVIFCVMVYSLSWFLPLMRPSSQHVVAGRLGLSTYSIHLVLIYVSFGFVFFIDLFFVYGD